MVIARKVSEVPEVFIPPSRVSVNIKKIKKLDFLDVGDKIDIKIGKHFFKGKVTSKSKNKNHADLDIEFD